jgi:hypothetical protein
VSIKTRLGKLEDLTAGAEPKRPQEPDSCRWLAILDLLAIGYEHAAEDATTLDNAEAARNLAAQLREAADLLRGYVEAGRIGAYTEYHCGCALVILAGWIQAKEGNPWHGQPFPCADEADKLRECLQIDRWHGLEELPAAINTAGERNHEHQEPTGTVGARE